MYEIDVHIVKSHVFKLHSSFLSSDVKCPIVAV